MSDTPERTCANCHASAVCDVRKANTETWKRLTHLDQNTPLNRGAWLTKVERITAETCRVFALDPRYA